MKEKPQYNDLEIIKKACEYGTYDINICRNLNDDKLYTVICIKDELFIHKTIGFFSKLRERTKFNDYVTCFSNNSFLYVVFLYYKEKEMDFIEMNKIPLMQKVEIVKQALSLAIIQDIPLKILYDVFSPSNINIDDGGTVYFNYFLTNIERYDKLTDKSGFHKLSSFIKQFFAKEIMEKSVEGLDKLVFKCSDGAYENVMNVYLDFNMLYDEFVKADKKSKEKKQKIIKIIINKIMGLLGKVMPIIVLAALCIGVVLIIVEYTGKLKNPNPAKIEYIGTEKVK